MRSTSDDIHRYSVGNGIGRENRAEYRDVMFLLYRIVFCHNGEKTTTTGFNGYTAVKRRIPAVRIDYEPPIVYNHTGVNRCGDWWRSSDTGSVREPRL